MIPLEIRVAPYLRDHRFQGRTVLPAVEAMGRLAASVGRIRPGARTDRIREARFDKFLFIEAHAEVIEAAVEMALLPDGATTARLVTRTRSPKTGITRAKVHAALRFAGPASRDGFDPPPLDPFEPAGHPFRISAGRLYRELVPFGPAFRNIRGDVRIDPARAVADVHAACHDPAPGPLGSPFPLDAAFHAACVWGQRFAGVVAFPVGIDRRTIHRPTRSGETYRAVVRPVETGLSTLVFDIGLFDAADGRSCEQVRGLRMRDVTGGRMRPPAWVVHPDR